MPSWIVEDLANSEHTQRSEFPDSSGIGKAKSTMEKDSAFNCEENGIAFHLSYRLSVTHTGMHNTPSPVVFFSFHISQFDAGLDAKKKKVGRQIGVAVVARDSVVTFF